MATATHSTPEERAMKRVKDRSGLMWHIATFVIINGFLWIVAPSAAIWVTLGWGIGLVFHLAAFVIGEPGTDSRHYQKYLAEERAREAQGHT